MDSPLMQLARDEVPTWMGETLEWKRESDYLYAIADNGMGFHFIFNRPDLAKMHVRAGELNMGPRVLNYWEWDDGDTALLFEPLAEMEQRCRFGQAVPETFSRYDLSGQKAQAFNDKVEEYMNKLKITSVQQWYAPFVHTYMTPDGDSVKWNFCIRFFGEPSYITVERNFYKKLEVVFLPDESGAKFCRLRILPEYDQADYDDEDFKQYQQEKVRRQAIKTTLLSLNRDETYQKNGLPYLPEEMRDRITKFYPQAPFVDLCVRLDARP